MYTLPFPLSAAPEMPRDKASEQDPYASEAQTNALLRFGPQYRLQRIQAAALGSTDGWQLLAFLESPHPALDGQSPRTALEQGTSAQRVINLATAEGH
jgi:hypothetical protein